MTVEKHEVAMKPKEAIPHFRTHQEEAEFWDTHDMADYWGEFKPVKARYAKNLSQGITIRLDPKTLAHLREQAHRKGVGPTTLARMWILEHLHSNSVAR